MAYAEGDCTMGDFELSFVLAADGKYKIALSVEFDNGDEALAFNGDLIDLCKVVLEAKKADAERRADEEATHMPAIDAI